MSVLKSNARAAAQARAIAAGAPRDLQALQIAPAIPAAARM